MASSSFPAARAALYTSLSGLTGAGGPLEGVQVSYGIPIVLEPEFVAVLNGSGKQQIAVVGRGHPRDEDNKTFILVHTVNSDPADVQTPLERVFTLMAAIETQLRADPSLGGAVRVAELEAWELDEARGDESRSCSLLLTIRLAQRI